MLRWSVCKARDLCAILRLSRYQVKLAQRPLLTQAVATAVSLYLSPSETFLIKPGPFRSRRRIGAASRGEKGAADA